jgi:hypothetical protein
MSTNKPLDFEKFNKFVFHIDDTLEKFSAIELDNGTPLDATSHSLSEFENLILVSNVSVENDLAINEYAQYLGEVVRKSYGGRWSLGDNPDSELDYNMPVISGFNDVGFVFNPILIVRNLVIRKNRGILVRAFEAQSGQDRLGQIKVEA